MKLPEIVKRMKIELHFRWRESVIAWAGNNFYLHVTPKILHWKLGTFQYPKDILLRKRMRQNLRSYSSSFHQYNVTPSSPVTPSVLVLPQWPSVQPTSPFGSNLKIFHTYLSFITEWLLLPQISATFTAASHRMWSTLCKNTLRYKSSRVNFLTNFSSLKNKFYSIEKDVTVGQSRQEKRGHQERNRKQIQKA